MLNVQTRYHLSIYLPIEPILPLTESRSLDMVKSILHNSTNYVFSTYLEHKM